MFPKLKISNLLLKRLEKVTQQCSGCLFGVICNGTIILIGFNVETTLGQLNYKTIQHKFPAEIDLCGLVKFGDCTDAEAHLNEILHDVDITDNPILLHCVIGTLVDLKASVYMHEKLQPIPFEVIDEQELYKDFCFSRLRCNLDLYTEENVAAIKQNTQKLRKDLAGGGLAFRLDKTNAYLIGGGNGAASNIPSHTKISEIFNILTNSSGEPIKSKKQSGKFPTQSATLFSEYDILNVKVLKGRTKDSLIDVQPGLKVVIKKNIAKLRIPLKVDAMAMLWKNTKILGLYDILIESICRSLRLIEQTMSDWVSEGNQLNEIPRTYHFAVPDFGHFISCVYLDNVSEDDSYALQKRKRLHNNFGLPLNRPYFRKANRYVFKSDHVKSGELCNVHIGLKPSGLKDGKQYLIQGKYTYYHYMQHNFDDNGWGCAYRSLQTLCSWYKWQGYSDRSIPTHEEIQKHLVKIGDKPASFIGSRQWIGSTEVAMCLNEFVNAESKIMHVNSGADLAYKGPELAMHFESQGTPIMIGGGQLAHTIIGIDFNSITGDVKFLILDPHYTGQDDLAIIQSKGWCGWKSPEFWDKKSYYNLCMPQRPYLY